jgi:hypothetical protein
MRDTESLFDYGVDDETLEAWLKITCPECNQTVIESFSKFDTNNSWSCNCGYSFIIFSGSFAKIQDDLTAINPTTKNLLK